MLSNRNYLIPLGTMYSGSGLIFDALKTVPFINDPLKGTEYLLPHTPGGLIDLLQTARQGFSRSCSDDRIRRLKKLMSVLGRKSSWHSKGMNYDQLLPRYENQCVIFLDQITSSDFEYDIFYRWLDQSIIERSYNRIFSPTAQRVNLIHNYDFIKQKICDFHDAIFPNTEFVLLNQAGCGWNPIESTSIFENRRVALVLRDPRDQYVELKKFKRAKNVIKFCEWYKQMMLKVNSHNSNSYFKIFKFENLVFESGKAQNELSKFFFGEEGLINYDFKKSEKNVGVFREKLTKEECFVIDKELEIFIDY